jgi:hypothetical protein
MRFENPNKDPKVFKEIGEGTQKRAFLDVKNPDSVTLEFKWPWRNEEIKAMFYIQKIAHLLFPNETIDVLQVGNVTDEQGKTTAYARTEYVSPASDPTHQRLQEILKPVEGLAYELEEGGEAEAELRAIMKESRKDKRVQAWYRLYAKVGLENRLAPLGRQDRIVDEQGNFKTVDIAVPWYIDDDKPEYKELLFDPKKLARAIAQLPEATRGRAHVYYERLLELCRQVGFDV